MEEKGQYSFWKVSCSKKITEDEFSNRKIKKVFQLHKFLKELLIASFHSTEVPVTSENCGMNTNLRSLWMFSSRVPWPCAVVFTSPHQAASQLVLTLKIQCSRVLPESSATSRGSIARAEWLGNHASINGNDWRLYWPRWEILKVTHSNPNTGWNIEYFGIKGTFLFPWSVKRKMSRNLTISAVNTISRQFFNRIRRSQVPPLRDGLVSHRTVSIRTALRNEEKSSQSSIHLNEPLDLTPYRVIYRCTCGFWKSAIFTSPEIQKIRELS